MFKPSSDDTKFNGIKITLTINNDHVDYELSFKTSLSASSQLCSCGRLPLDEGNPSIFTLDERLLNIIQALPTTQNLPLNTQFYLFDFKCDIDTKMLKQNISVKMENQNGLSIQDFKFHLKTYLTNTIGMVFNTQEKKAPHCAIS